LIEVYSCLIFKRLKSLWDKTSHLDRQR